MNADLFRRFKFFKEHAGCAACALSLARAELWRKEQEEAGLLRIRWEWDCEPYEPCACGKCKPPDEVLGCVLETNDSGRWEHGESLWGIADPDNAYRRVVEAELAAELLHKETVREVSGVLSV